MARHRVGARTPRKTSRRARGHRVVRPDARPGGAGRQRRRHPPRDPVERPENTSGVHGDREHDRARTADRADRQPRADRLHRAEDPVAQAPRTGELRTHREHPPAQGLRPPPPDRRARHRRLGRLRDAPARRREPQMERRGPRGRSRSTRPGSRPALESPTVSGQTDRRHTRRCRRRRPGRRRARRRRRPARTGVGGARHQWRRVRRARRVRRRPAGARPRVLPRGARQMARDGRDAVRRRLALLAARRHGPQTPNTTRCSKKPRPGRPAPRASSSCPTSPASGPRTPTPTPAAPSSVSASATTAAP